MDTKAAEPPRTAEARPAPEPSPGGSPDPPADAPAGTGPAQVRGTIVGPGAGSVEAVVLLGPDSLLREAARARPATDGSWSVERLAPGSYRVQLDAGGGRVVLAEPPYRTIVVTPGGTISVPELHVRSTSAR